MFLEKTRKNQNPTYVQLLIFIYFFSEARSWQSSC